MRLRRKAYLFFGYLKSLRGMTLAELIVISAVFVGGMGILFAILIETRASAVRGQDQIAMENQARLVASEACALLQSAVRPQSLDLSTSAPLRFAANECSIISSSNFNGKDLYLTTIRTIAASDSEGEDGSLRGAPKRKRVQVYRSILDPKKTIDAREENHSLGTDQSRYSYSIEFEYASSAEETLELRPFAHELAGQDYPRVIRIRIHVEPAMKKQNRIEPAYDLTTAVRIL